MSGTISGRKNRAKVSKRDSFDISGPLYLTCVDWNNVHHRRVVAACLVQAVYVLERDRDRQKNAQGADALAPPWWEFCHFKLSCTLVDAVDSSIFGAVFEYNPPLCGHNDMHDAPQRVVAFRGTITKGDCVSQDLRLDLHVIKNGLHLTPRFEMAMQAVVAASEGSSNIWIAGHSLGSAIAMLAGKNMARTGIFLEAFLFNPPFLSAPIGRIKDEKVRHGIRVAGSLITAGLALARKGNNQRQRSEDPFVMLSAWLPSLFVHPGDHICSEYIGYFEHRKKMEDIGAGTIERLASQNSLTNLFFNSGGNAAEPLHLLPSATLTTNLTPALTFKEAHAIQQWWREDLNLHTNLYRY